MCEQREQLLDYLYDEATPAGRRQVERHLDACDECRDELRAFRNVREDMLAWGVPNPPSVWSAFTPAPVVPWHKQVPAWALAAAASLMLVVGSAGGFIAHNVVDGSSADAGVVSGAGVLPPAVVQSAGLDAAAIMTLIKEELAKADRNLTGRASLVNNSAARPSQLDPVTEERLMSRVTELVNERDEQRRLILVDYLTKVKNEDDRLHREEQRRLSMLTAQVDVLQAQVGQLVLAQSKGQ